MLTSAFNWFRSHYSIRLKLVLTLRDIPRCGRPDSLIIASYRPEWGLNYIYLWELLETLWTLAIICPTLAKGSKWYTIQIWVIDVFLIHIMSSSSQAKFHTETLILLWDIIDKTSWYSIDLSVKDSHILLLYENCHICHLLSFAKVGQYCRHQNRYATKKQHCCQIHVNILYVKHKWTFKCIHM